VPLRCRLVVCFVLVQILSVIMVDVAAIVVVIIVVGHGNKKDVTVLVGTGLYVLVVKYEMKRTSS